MDRPAVTWDHYRSFLAVVREGSLSGAARRLGLTQPTVGRHVDALERSLDAALFVRHRAGLSPTEQALDLVAHAEAMESAAAALVRQASGEAEEPQGTVRITASEIVGCEVLPGVLARFRADYPGIELELMTSDRVSNLLTREADIAVRMTRPEQGALVAKRIGVVPIGLFAHRHYVRRHGIPRSVAELRQHSGIGFDQDARAYAALRAHGIELDRSLFDFRTDSNPAQLAALRAGMGIGGVQKAIAARDPDLVPVLPDEFGFSLEMWLAMHEDLRSVRRVRLLFEFLAQALEQWVEAE
ncbi:MAG TPA: LysR family transcriptional regulator [Arenicellales bacterium]|nr:LysR family transcriptional regulator [Arenicellales bacterium]